MCHRVQLGAYLRACSGVYLRAYSEVYLGAYSECTRERLESLLGSVSQQAGSVQSSAIRSVLQSVLGSVQ